MNRILFSSDDHVLLSNNTIVFLSFLYLWRLGRTWKTLYLNLQPCPLLAGPQGNSRGTGLSKLPCLECPWGPLVEPHCHGAQETLLSKDDPLSPYADWGLHVL